MIKLPAAGKPSLTVAQFPDALAGDLREKINLIKADDLLAGVVVVVPSEAATDYTEYELASSGVNLANVRFSTFAGFAREHGQLRFSHLPVLPPGADLALAFNSLNNSQSTNDPFSEAAQFPGFGRTILRSLTDLYQAKITNLQPSTFATQRKSKYDRLKALDKCFRLFNDQLSKYSGTEGSLFSTEEAVLNRRGDRDDDSHVILYGLYDFNQLQYDFVKDAAHRIPVSFLIPGVSSNGKLANAFQFVERFIERIGRDFPDMNIEYVESPSVFGNSIFNYEISPVRDENLSSKLSVFAASDPVAECDLIAGKIIELLGKSDVPLPAIGIVLWRSEIYRPLLLESLKKASIPVYDGIGTSLGNSASGIAFRELLSLSHENIGCREILDLLQSNGMARPELPNGLPNAYIEEVVNVSGIVRGGAEAWERSLRAARLHNESDERRNMLESVAKAFSHYMVRLFVLLERLNTSTDIAEKFATSASLVTEFLEPGLEREAILTRLSDLSTISDQLITLTNREFKQFITNSLNSVILDRGKAIQDGVALLAPLTARNIRFDYLFLPGFNQGQVPVLTREDTLLGDEVRRRVNQLASGNPEYPLPLSSMRSAEEKLLFTQLLSSASQRVTISYSRRSLAEGKEEYPSHFLFEACRSATQQSIGYEDLPTLKFFEDFSGGDRSPGWEGRILDSEDYAKIMLGDVPMANRREFIKEVFGNGSEFVDRLQLVADQRGIGENWSEFDGIAARRQSSTTVPKYAVTELEAYAECPFRCWLTRRLKLNPWREPEISIDLPSSVIGIFIHRIYQQIFDLAKRKGRLFLREVDVAWIEESLPRILHDLRAKIRSECPAPVVVWNIVEKTVQERVLASLPNLISLQRYPLGSCEVSVRETIHITRRDGGQASVELEGKIDRLDVSETGDGFQIIDYKTGAVGKPEDLKDGTKLQLPIYMRLLLAGNNQFDPQKSSASYDQITADGGVKEFKIDGGWLQENRDQVDWAIEATVKGLEEGLFPPLPANNKSCEYCAVDQYCDYKSRMSAEYRQGDQRMGLLQNLRREE